MADNYYDAGTATVVNGSTAVTGTGTTWSTWGLLAGDTLNIGGVGVPIASVNSNTSLTLAYGWPGVGASAVAHVVLYTSPRRSGADIMVKVRELLAQIDLLGGAVPYYEVQSLGANTPPASPTAGDLYVVGTSPTGAWAGQAKNIASWTGSVWKFTVPDGGWHAYSVATNLQFAYVAGSWQLTDGVASVVGQTGTVTAAHIEAGLSNFGFRNLFRNARFLVNQRGFVSGASLAAKAFGIDGVAGGPSGATVAYANDGAGLFDRYLDIATGSIVLPISGTDIAGGNYRLSYEGTAQYRIWAGTPSGSYATAFRSAGGAAVFLTAGVDAFVEFTGGTLLRPQLEIGNLGPFERAPLGLERVRCLAFFERRTAQHLGPGTVFSGVGMGAYIYYAYKRTAPTLTFNNAGDLRAVTNSGSYAATIGTVTANPGSAFVTVGGPPTAGESGFLGYSTARSLDISSELVW